MCNWVTMLYSRKLTECCKPGIMKKKITIYEKKEQCISNTEFNMRAGLEDFGAEFYYPICNKRLKPKKKKKRTQNLHLSLLLPSHNPEFLKMIFYTDCIRVQSEKATLGVPIMAQWKQI